MGDTMLALDEKVKQIPNLELAQAIYRYDTETKAGDAAAAQSLKDGILKDVERDAMTPLYIGLCSKLGWAVDNALVERMTSLNETKLVELEAALEDATVNAGDMEVLDGLFAKARHFSSIGSWEQSYAAYDEVLKKEKTSSGKKVDATMEKARISLFQMDTVKLKTLLADAKRLIDAGGDWDRRNRLKVYEALYLIMMRDIRGASALLLECIATFTCVELCTYKQFMFYALVTSVMCLPRIDIKKKVVDNPHVISVIRDLPNVQTLLHSIYRCEYHDFFKSLLSVHPDIIDDRYMGPHCAHIVREYRILAYSQFLEAYKSVMMSSMARSFGLSLGLLDEELSKFIAAGRLNAKIDKVGGIIETSRPDKKSAQYQEVIKKGDMLLNHIQKLVRVIDV